MRIKGNLDYRFPTSHSLKTLPGILKSSKMQQEGNTIPSHFSPALFHSTFHPDTIYHVARRMCLFFFFFFRSNCFTSVHLRPWWWLAASGIIFLERNWPTQKKRLTSGVESSRALSNECNVHRGKKKNDWMFLICATGSVIPRLRLIYIFSCTTVSTKKEKCNSALRNSRKICCADKINDVDDAYSATGSSTWLGFVICLWMQILH